MRVRSAVKAFVLALLLCRAQAAVADLDPQLVIVLGDHQQRTIVDLFAADLPGFGCADRELLDGLGRRGRHDQHRNLAALAPLQILQPR